MFLLDALDSRLEDQNLADKTGELLKIGKSTNSRNEYIWLVRGIVGDCERRA